MTILYTPQAKSWYQARESDAGNVHGVIGYMAIPADYTQNDVVQMVKIPLGATVMEVILETGALGTNVDVTVGDGDDTDRYIKQTTHAAAAVTRRNQTDKVGVPSTYSAEDTIDVVIMNAAPTDNIAMRLDVFYITGVDTTP